MEEYNVEGRLITKDDWEKWLKSKEESDRRLSTIPEPSAKKEIRYAVIEWHKYPQEKPKVENLYLVSIRDRKRDFTSASWWESPIYAFRNWDKDVTAWAEMPEPYEEQT